MPSISSTATQGRTDPDDAPEPPAHPVAEPGDLWVLGRHRLLCGDSTVATDVERVLDGVAPQTLSACSVASRRTLWSPTRATGLITTRLGAIRPADPNAAFGSFFTLSKRK